jgi:acyl dehydratase
MPAQALSSLPGLLLRAAVTLRRHPQGRQPLPALQGHFKVAGIAKTHVARYRQIFAAPGSHVPLTYFYLLAQRAQIAQMLDARFPHAIPGLIHVRNEMRLHALCRETSSLDLHVSLQPHRPGDDGRRVKFVVNISTAGRLLASCISEYQTGRGTGKAQTAGPEALPGHYVTTDWAVAPATIRRYAFVSGDCNPIHLSSLLARAFGLRRAIAHGMYVVGQAAAAIERRSGRPLIAIDAHFRRPVPVPARLSFGFVATGGTQGDYGVLLPDQQRLAVSGAWECGTDETLEPLPLSVRRRN